MDLEREYHIDHIKIMGRSDCCRERMGGVVVSLFLNFLFKLQKLAPLEITEFNPKRLTQFGTVSRNIGTTWKPVSASPKTCIVFGAIVDCKFQS